MIPTRRTLFMGAAALAAARVLAPDRAYALQALAATADWSLATADVEDDIAPRALRLVHGRAPQGLGSTPVRVGSPARAMPMPERLVLQAGGDRLYRGEGEINGRAISGVVDTGASVMVVPAAQARRLGLPEQGGREVDVQTAAGRSVGRRVKIDRVRLGPLEARDVDAVVIDVDLPYVLYGNSFLQDFHLQWGQGRLTLSVAPPP